MLVLLNGLQAGNQSGTGRYTVELVRWLPRLADDVEVAVYWPESVAPPPSAKAATFVMRPHRGTVRRILSSQFAMKKERRRLKADIVHYPANIGNFTPMAQTVLTIHDLSFLRDPAWFTFSRGLYNRLAVARSARLASRIIADSQATAEDLIEFLRVDQSRIDVIPLGVDEAYRPVPNETQAEVKADVKAEVRKKYGLPESFFLFVGTLEPRKNITRIIQAWSTIADNCEYDLVIAGREGWKVESIRKAAAQSVQTARIHFTGFIEQDDLPALLATAHAFVWPSLWEGFGLPPLEAMACGVPVLTSNRSSLPEVVGDGALTVDPLSVEAIAEGMMRIAKEDGLRSELRAKGLARAAQFTWKRTAELTLDTYRKVLGA